MNHKKRISLCALALGLTIFTGCATTGAIEFEPYWMKNALVNEEGVYEKLEYAVTFEKGSDSLQYELSYDNGKYVTELRMENGNYVYTTNLTIDVIYTLNGDSKNWTDYVTTETVFATTKDNLYPVSSTKSIYSHSPSYASSTPSKIENCYKEYDYQIETTYSSDGNTCKIVKNSSAEAPNEFSTKGAYRYIDNEQLLFALRGLSSNTTAGSFFTYSPFVKRLQSVKFTCADAGSKKYTFAMNGTSQEKEILQRSVQFYLDENNMGNAQTAIFAALTSTMGNEYRNVMLSLKSPLSYNVGALIYTLRSATFS